MGKILFIIGRSATGKSTICNELVKRLNFKPVISHTSRPIREGEINGIDYHYISKIEFFIEILKGNMLEHTKYNGWLYGVHKNSIDDDNYIIVSDPVGFKKLKKKFPNCMSVYITTDDKKKLIRSLEREEHPDCDEICRRFLSDRKTFKAIEKKVDYVVENNGSLDDTVNKIIELMNERWI